MPVPCFLLFLVSEISTQKISSKSGEIFSSEHITSGSFRSPKTTWGGGPRGPHPMGARPRVGPRPARVWWPWLAPGSHPSPIYSPRLKTLIQKKRIHEKFRRGRHRQSQIGGVLTFSRHPAGGEIITGGFYIIMPASRVMRE